MKEKLEELCRRFDELTARMGDPEIYADPSVFQQIAKESAELEPIANTYRKIENARVELADAKEMLQLEDEQELLDMIRGEVSELESLIETESKNLQMLLLPKDPNDEKNVIWKSVLARVAMKPPFSQATYSECIRDTARKKGGESRL